MQVTAEELSLVRQNNQRRYVKLQVINRDWQSVGIIRGRLISCNVSIDGTTTMQRSANIAIITEDTYLKVPAADISIDLQRDMPADYYIKLWAGIEDNNTLRVRWYNQGIFIISESSYTFDPSTRTLSMTLIDLMNDLNGTRGGQLHAFTSLVKYDQRIDDVAKNVMEMVGIQTYSIEPITVLRPTNTPVDENVKETDYKVPYDIKFNVGVTAYEILEKLVGLYPYYEMGFDVNGVFYVRKQLLEQDDSYVILPATDYMDLVLSEDTSIDWNYVRNHIEVWGKDGLYYGEADDTNPESLFQINGTKKRVLVVTDNQYGVDTSNICDRYKDETKATELLQAQAALETEIARIEAIKEPTEKDRTDLRKAKADLEKNKQEQEWNIDVKGNDLAKEWAERILYDRTRLQDNITIKTVLMPFLNDVGFKMSYRTKVDNIVRPYVVKSISHDFAGGTTTINMIRFYNDMCVNYWEQLGTPVITNASGIGMDIVVVINNVEYAETYALYIDGIKRGTYTDTIIIYSMPEAQAGSHTVQVVAEAPYYRSSDFSNSITVTVAPQPEESNIIVTDTGDYITTSDGFRIKYNEG